MSHVVHVNESCHICVRNISHHCYVCVCVCVIGVGVCMTGTTGGTHSKQERVYVCVCVCVCVHVSVYMPPLVTAVHTRIHTLEHEHTHYLACSVCLI